MWTDPLLQDRSTSGTPRSGTAGQGDAVDPAVPGPVARAAAAIFGALSRLRGRRIFHPVGVGYSGTFTVQQPLPGYGEVPLLARTGEHPVVVRFSRAVGLPEPLPDALGLALRLVDVHGPGRHQDFVLVTSADGPLLHHLLLPNLRGFFGQSFSSLLLYRVGGRLRVVGAQPVARVRHAVRGALPELIAGAGQPGVHFRIALASPLGRWQPVGDLRLLVRLSDEETERLAFTPWNTGGGIRPVGPLMGLRRAAYRGSQRGRGVPDADVP
jgi:hypothetical protein